MVNGSAYERETRAKVDNLVIEVKELKTSLGEQFAELRETNKELYNHLSSRLPMWVTILFTIFGSLIVGLTVAFLR